MRLAEPRTRAKKVTRVCPRCGETDPAKFGRNRSERDGRSVYCKACARAYSRETYYRARGLPVPPENRGQRRRLTRLERIDGAILAYRAILVVCERRMGWACGRALVATVAELAHAKVRLARLAELRAKMFPER